MAIMLVQFGITFFLLLVLAILVIANKSKKQDRGVGCSAKKRNSKGGCACGGSK